jgi:hypothetical protein
VASEEIIQSIELHKETPHDIADSTFLFTHKKFSFFYNNDQVRDFFPLYTAQCSIYPLSMPHYTAQLMSFCTPCLLTVTGFGS